MKILFAIIALLAVACNRGEEDVKKPACDVEFRATHLIGTYHGTEYSKAYNYNIVLSDYSADSDSFAPNASYYYFELYSDIYSEGGAYVNLPVANGTSRQYRYDQYNKRYNGTFTAERSYAIFTDSEGNPTRQNYTSGTLNIAYKEGNKVEIVADIVMEDGKLHRIKYQGSRTFYNLYNDPYSTLYTDLEFSLSDMTLYTESLGNYYDDVDCHYFMLSEDAEGKNGKVFLIELLIPHNKESICGTYTPFATTAESYTELAYTYFPGSIEQDVLRGAWYVEMEDGSVGATMAPIADGKIAISEKEEGPMLFEFDCSDDAGHKIRGTATTL